MDTKDRVNWAFRKTSQSRLLRKAEFLVLPILRVGLLFLMKKRSAWFFITIRIMRLGAVVVSWLALCTLLGAVMGMRLCAFSKAAG